jgi:hypothetical protein
MTQPHTHASHPAIIKRLRRASGHLSSTIEMLAQGRACLEDLVGPLGVGQRHSLDEFREITRYL